MRCGATQSDLSDPNLAYVTCVADAIENARRMPGVNLERLAERLKNNREFDGTLYELETASSYRHMGQVEFVPTADEQRTSDLRVSRGDQSVWVECQRKDRIVPAASGSYDSEILEKGRVEILSLAPPESDVLVTSIGTEVSAINEVLSFTKEVVASGQQGTFRNRKLEAWVMIDHQTSFAPQSPIEDGHPGVSLRHGLIDGAASVSFKMNSSGSFEYSDHRRLQFCVLESHKMRSIVNGFNNKRQCKQIPADGIGVFQFDVDLSRLHPANWVRYLRLAGEIVASRAWIEGANERIGGIVLTGSQFLARAIKDGCTFLVPVIPRLIVRNRNSRLPEWFSFPNH